MASKQDQVKVTFEKMVVHDNGDTKVGGGKGELYWRFSVDGTTLVERSSSNPDKTKDGETIFLGESRVVSKPRTSGAYLTIGGYVADKDGGFSGKAEQDDFSKSWSYKENWGAGTRQVNLQDGHLDVTLHYKVEVF